MDAIIVMITEMNIKRLVLIINNNHKAIKLLSCNEHILSIAGIKKNMKNLEKDFWEDQVIFLYPTGHYIGPLSPKT